MFASLESAVGPVVMVSAAGLLFNGIQTKNLHLSDRIRALMAELRLGTTAEERRKQVMEQIPLFHRRIRLSQWSLNMLYVSIVCFALTSLLLTSALWIGAAVLPSITTMIFGAGVVFLIVALVLEFVELSIALRSIDIEMRDAGRAAGR